MTTSDTSGTYSAELPDGVRIPLLGLGTWRLNGEEARRAVGWALEADYRHVDTATSYGNEAEVGEALRNSGLPRDEVFVTTKMPPDRVGRELQTLTESLEALGLDHVDLWLVHWPPGRDAGVDSWAAFVKAREEGLARAIGVSNYSLDQVDELTAATGVTPAVNQVKWNPFLFDADMLAGSRTRNVVLEGYSPFRAGRLGDPLLVEIAGRHGKAPAQVVVRWHVQHGVVVIPKSAQQDRIASNAAVFDFQLSSEEMAAIDALSGGS